MTECLEKNVLNNKEFTLLDETTAIRIVTENNRAVGLIAVQKNGSLYSFIPISAKYIIAATGGASTVYKNTVYPDSQAGSFGLMADAGCKFCNLTEWQYGIVSVGVKSLFAVGETAGTFGIYRPGGSALNSTQVGALRVAEYISRDKTDFADEYLIHRALWEESDYIEE